MTRLGNERRPISLLVLVMTALIACMEASTQATPRSVNDGGVGEEEEVERVEEEEEEEDDALVCGLSSESESESEESESSKSGASFEDSEAK